MSPIERKFAGPHTVAGVMAFFNQVVADQKRALRTDLELEVASGAIDVDVADAFDDDVRDQFETELDQTRRDIEQFLRSTPGRRGDDPQT